MNDTTTTTATTAEETVDLVELARQKQQAQVQKLANALDKRLNAAIEKANAPRSSGYTSKYTPEQKEQIEQIKAEARAAKAELKAKYLAQRAEMGLSAQVKNPVSSIMKYKKPLKGKLLPLFEYCQTLDAVTPENKAAARTFALNIGSTQLVAYDVLYKATRFNQLVNLGIFTSDGMLTVFGTAEVERLRAGEPTESGIGQPKNVSKAAEE